MQKDAWQENQAVPLPKLLRGISKYRSGNTVRENRAVQGRGMYIIFIGRCKSNEVLRDSRCPKIF